MTSSFNSSMSAAAEPLASRREIVAAAVTVAAAAATTTGNAQAQTPPMLRFSNPPGMSTPPTYSHVVEVNGPHRTVYLAGQAGVDRGVLSLAHDAFEPEFVSRRACSTAP